VPPQLVQRVLNMCEEHRHIPLPFHLDGRGGRRVCFTDENSRAAPRAIPVIESASEHFRNMNTTDPEDADTLEALLNRGEIELREGFVAPARRIRATKCSPEAASSSEPEHDGNCTSCPEAHKPDQPTCTGGFDFTFIELFAGIGGFRLACEKIGGHCGFASEIDEAAVATYLANFGEVPHGDVTAVPDDEIPEHDLLTAGFPCQPFSTLGDQPGLEDDKGVLFREIVRILYLRRPRAFLLENVVGLLTCDGGRAFSAIVEALEGAGYVVTYHVINSRTLTPQNRKRVYIVGVRDDLGLAPFAFPFIPDIGIRLEAILEPEQQIEPNVDEVTLSQDQWLKVQGSPSFRRWRSMAWPDRPAAAIISHYRSDLRNCQVVPRAAPHNPRFFTKRECARLQGFPDSFQTGSTTRSANRFYHQIGNAVTVPIVCCIAGAVLCHLEHSALLEHGCNMPGISPALEIVMQTISKDENKNIAVRLPDGSNEVVGSLIIHHAV